MRAAATPARDGRDAKLLVVDASGRIAHHRRADLARLVHAGDLVVANDAATLPASLRAVHTPSGREVEIRLAGSRSIGSAAAHFTAVVFGRGDFRTPTERRASPPDLRPGDELIAATLRVRVTAVHGERAVDWTAPGHPRLVELTIEHDAAAIWEAIARHGRPIQYAYVAEPLAIWDTWTAIANRPAAFEAPSAGFVLDWAMLKAIRRRGAGFATLTHAAGISSTGDANLDRLLPLDEPYDIPASTADAINAAKARAGRIVAIGTTVVRALEHAAFDDGRVRAGGGLATNRLGPDTPLRSVDAIVSGVHEAGTSHYELLRAFADGETLERMLEEMEGAGYAAHEFGDAVFIERAGRRIAAKAEASALREGTAGASRSAGASAPARECFLFALGREVVVAGPHPE